MTAARRPPKAGFSASRRPSSIVRATASPVRPGAERGRDPATPPPDPTPCPGRGSPTGGRRVAQPGDARRPRPPRPAAPVDGRRRPRRPRSPSAPGRAGRSGPMAATRPGSRAGQPGGGAEQLPGQALAVGLDDHGDAPGRRPRTARRPGRPRRPRAAGSSTPRSSSTSTRRSTCSSTGPSRISPHPLDLEQAHVADRGRDWPRRPHGPAPRSAADSVAHALGAARRPGRRAAAWPGRSGARRTTARPAAARWRRPTRRRAPARTCTSPSPQVELPHARWRRAGRGAGPAAGRPGRCRRRPSCGPTSTRSNGPSRLEGGGERLGRGQRVGPGEAPGR